MKDIILYSYKFITPIFSALFEGWNYLRKSAEENDVTSLLKNKNILRYMGLYYCYDPKLSFPLDPIPFSQFLG